MNISHFHLQSRDWERSIAFYRDAMGFRELARVDKTAYLRDENGFDFLIDNEPDSKAAGPAIHIGFRQPTKEAVEERFSQLKDTQEIIQSYVDEGDFAVFVVRDPDGMDVEIFYSKL